MCAGRVLAGAVAGAAIVQVLQGEVRRVGVALHCGLVCEPSEVLCAAAASVPNGEEGQNSASRDYSFQAWKSIFTACTPLSIGEAKTPRAPSQSERVLLTQ